jgi:hypothetical protein
MFHYKPNVLQNGSILTRRTQDFVVDGGMTKAYVTPEGPAAPAPVNNASKSSLD